MKRIYEVEYEEKWTGCAEWLPDSIKVIGNGDALSVISKARKHCLGQRFTDEESGKLNKCTGFRFLGVKVVATADI